MDEKIRAAYDKMSPTPEQEERMLDALLAAQSEYAGSQQAPAPAGGASSPNPGDPGPGGSSPDSPNPGDPSRKRTGFKAWMAAVPLAACLALGAVVIGAGGLGGGTTNAPVAPGQSLEAAPQSVSAAPTQSERETATSVVSTNEKRDDAGQAAMPNAAAETDGAVELTGGLAAYDTGEVDIDPYYGFDPGNTEEYTSLDESGFVSTRTRPLSTVSADVDTASYCNVRRLIREAGGAASVPTGAVRMEEMLNYFDYGYARPTDGSLFSLQAEVAQCPWNPDTQLLVLGFATPAETGVAEKGANLVFLVDVSGSMASTDKLALLQDSFSKLLEHLDENDRVSIVTYASGEDVVLDGVAGNETVEITKAIYKLRASGSTNGEAGLQKAYEVAERNYIEGGVNRIVMASDGDLNVGITSESDLHDLVDSKRETGIYLSVLGFGAGNYKDTKMETLADHGNGSYHYIDCIDEAEHVLSDKLMANLVPFADDVKVQVEFNPAQVKGYRLIGYENRGLADEDFVNDAVDAGDVGPGSQFTVAYEIVPASSSFEVVQPSLKYEGEPPTPSDSSELLTCALRYRAFSDGEVHEQELSVDESDVTAAPSADWRFASAVIEFGMLLRQSDHVGSASYDSVQEILEGLDLSAQQEGFRELVGEAARTVR